MCCPDHQTISAFADGELEAGQAAEVERHIAKCSSCRQLVEELQWLADCGRGALSAIHVGETATPNIVWWKPLRRKWARPLSLAAAAAVLLALSIWPWIASSHFGRHQAASAPHQIASVTATPPGRNGQSKESEDTAFEQWAAPYRELHIPLVSMEVVESYNPGPILPILPDDIEIIR
jgi:anti-sigma factor RsiW